MTEGGSGGDRAAELVGAALAGDLSEAEQVELDALCDADPGLAEELAELRQVVGLVGDARPDWSDQSEQPADEPPPSLAGRVAAIPATEAQAHGRGAPGDGARVVPLAPRGEERGRRRRWPRLLAGAAGLLLAGAVGGQLVRSAVDAPPDGPPGTLGAVEPVAFGESVEDEDLQVSVVAHTWGTETVLEMEDTQPGETYEVVLVDQAGTTYPAGTFAGSSERVVCRMNAALRRPDVATLQVRATDGSYARVARLPGVAG